jgi:hypothetical protein
VKGQDGECYKCHRQNADVDMVNVLTEWYFHAFSVSHARTANSNRPPWDGSGGPGLGLRFSSCRETIPAGMVFQLGM